MIINKKDIEVKEMVFLKLNPMPSYIFECRMAEDTNKEYKKFYEWLLKNCTKDNEDVIQKKLEYLVLAYNDLIKQLKEKQQSEDKFIELLLLTNECKKRLNKFYDKTIEEYNSYDKLNKDMKKYSYYDDLLSWYSYKTDITDKIVDNFYKMSQKISIKHDANSEVHYISTIKKENIEKKARIEWECVK